LNSKLELNCRLLCCRNDLKISSANDLYVGIDDLDGPPKVLSIFDTEMTFRLQNSPVMAFTSERDFGGLPPFIVSD